MTKTKVGLLSAAGTAAVMIVLAVVVVTAFKWFGEGWWRSELRSQCETTPIDHGGDGYCVVVSRYAATPFRSERFLLEIAPVYDGKPLSYRFVSPYPFSLRDVGQELGIDWSDVEEKIVITEPEGGTSITYLADSYAGGR